MFKKMLVVAAGALIALSASAFDRSQVQKSIELKDGSTVYILKDGKMGMENKFGKTVSMKPGEVMETKDGQRIIMVGNEVMRLEDILHSDHRN
ncbi:hypothetical protein GCM10027343_23970 [Noviherbaspirillum agri]